MRIKKFVAIGILLSVLASVSMPAMASHGDLGGEILLSNDDWSAWLIA